MSLQLWMPLTKDLRQQGVSGITPTQTTGYTSVAAGKLGGCYKFTGTFDTLLPLSNWNWTEGSVSFGCWAKISQSELATLVNAASYDATYNSMGGTLLGRDSYGGLGLRWKTNNIYSSSTLSAVYIYVHMRNTSSSSNNTSLYTIPFDTWFHVMTVIDRDENKIKVYINGELFTSTNLTVTGTFSTGTFRIAEATWDGGNGRASAGCWQLNDVRVYDYALSQMEVKEIAKGLVLHYPLADTSLDSKPNLVPPNYWIGSKSLSLSANTTSYSFMNYPTMNVKPNTTYYWTIDVRITSGAANLTSLGIDTNCIAGGYSGNDSAHTVITVVNPNLTKIKAGEWQTAYCITTVKADATNPQILHCLYGASSTATTVQVEYRNLMLVEASDRVPLRFWQSDIGYDCSGYCNNGNKVGTLTCDFDTPKYNVSTHFNGSSAIKNNNFPFSSNQWTASFWYKFTSAPSAYQGFLCLSRNAGGDSDKKIAAMPNSNYIWIKFESINYTLSSLKVNEWCHIALTCDGNVGKVYENGVLKYTTSSVGSILTNCDDFVVGARANSADAATTAVYLNGNMSDVRIYATALSANDVKSLYQNEAYIDASGNIYGKIRN